MTTMEENKILTADEFYKDLVQRTDLVKIDEPVQLPAVVENFKLSKKGKKKRFKGNQDLEKIIKHYRRILSRSVNEEYEIDIYNHSYSLVKSYSSSLIENFSLLLEYHQNKEDFAKITGLYLSALINKSEDSEIIIDTSNLYELIDYLGYQNSKKLIVRGDLGDHIGHKNKGEILIYGDLEDSLGYSMKDGKIIVEGNVGEQVGVCSEGGEIHLNGNYKNIYENSCLASIYRKGELIFKGNKGDKKVEKVEEVKPKKKRKWFFW